MVNNAAIDRALSLCDLSHQHARQAIEQLLGQDTKIIEQLKTDLQKNMDEIRTLRKAVALLFAAVSLQAARNQKCPHCCHRGVHAEMARAPIAQHQMVPTHTVSTQTSPVPGHTQPDGQPTERAMPPSVCATVQPLEVQGSFTSAAARTESRMESAEFSSTGDQVMDDSSPSGPVETEQQGKALPNLCMPLDHSAPAEESPAIARPSHNVTPSITSTPHRKRQGSQTTHSSSNPHFKRARLDQLAPTIDAHANNSGRPAPDAVTGHPPAYVQRVGAPVRDKVIKLDNNGYRICPQCYMIPTAKDHMYPHPVFGPASICQRSMFLF
ncbi:hypothetical protein EV714DRAFT_276684 [Schizophyllum commune]